MLGTSIGNYTVTAKLGEGGQGTVYLAEHAVLGRRAAVKVLLPQLSNQREVVARFFNEARAATAIRHPSIVEVFDVGYLPDASAYIVMELLGGESLGVRLRRVGRLEPARAVALVRQIAGALAAAHDCGIVHRDLKPDNVFVVPDPEVPGGERIKILDFGIAKLAVAAGEVSRTQTGTVLGTPTYIAPEQCRASGQVDARADLYALGCVLYELVSGRPPFVGDGSGDLIAHHLYFEPQPPRSHEPTLPEPLDRLILWLLRKDPAARPQTARDLVAAIDQLDLGTAGSTGPMLRLAMSAVSLPAHSTTLSSSAGVSLIRRQGSRRRWLSAAVAVATVAVGLAIYFAVHAGRSAERGGDRVEDRAATTGAAPAIAPPSGPSGNSAPAVAGPPPGAAATPNPGPPPGAAAKSVEPARPEPAYVHLALASDPPGAAVLVDGKPIGVTPLDDRVVAGKTSRAYTLRKDGYEPATVTLDTAHDGSRRVTLRKQPPHKPATPASLGDKGINPFDR